MADPSVPSPARTSRDTARWPSNIARQSDIRHHDPRLAKHRAPGWSLAEARLKTPLALLFAKAGSRTIELADADYENAASSIGVEVEAIMAVAQVETAGDAFDDRGRPRILFERHHFHRHTGGKYDASNPDISNPQRGGYGQFSVQYDKLEEAYSLDEDAALKSASWGRFQIMGSNHRAAGFATVKQFVTALARSEGAHLQAFVNFIRSSPPMLAALRNKDWAGFAKRYNGPAYYVKGYDQSLEKAYNGFVKERADKKSGLR